MFFKCPDLEKENNSFMSQLKLASVPWERITTAFGRAEKFASLLSDLETMNDFGGVKNALDCICEEVEVESALTHVSPIAMVFLARDLVKALNALNDLNHNVRVNVDEDAALYVVDTLIDFCSMIVSYYYELHDSPNLECFSHFANLLDESNLAKKLVVCSFELQEDLNKEHHLHKQLDLIAQHQKLENITQEEEEFFNRWQELSECKQLDEHTLELIDSIDEGHCLQEYGSLDDYASDQQACMLPIGDDSDFEECVEVFDSFHSSDALADNFNDDSLDVTPYMVEDELYDYSDQMWGSFYLFSCAAVMLIKPCLEKSMDFKIKDEFKQKIKKLLEQMDQLENKGK